MRRGACIEGDRIRRSRGVSRTARGDITAYAGVPHEDLGGGVVWAAPIAVDELLTVFDVRTQNAAAA
jgi:hypothetical protein